MNKKNKKDWGFYSLIIGFIVLFLASAIIFNIYNAEILPSQFYGALIGVFITAIVTAFLLRGQTEGDEKREISVKVFEKKQEVYHAFLEKFQKIIQSGDITIGVKKEDGTVDYTIDDLKDLIFQLAFIQMHTSAENTKKVLMCIADIKETLNDFKETLDRDKHKEQEKFYSNLSSKLFEIVAILKTDLYQGTEIDAIPKAEMESILKKFELYVEVKDADEYEMQNYFWDELQKQLKQKGYDIKEHDFKQDVSEYYSRTRKRHWYYGINFSLHINNIDGKEVTFFIQIENRYYYGFNKGYEGDHSDIMTKIIQKVSSGLKENVWWWGWKFPSPELDLDFWKLDSPGFKLLRHPKRREQLLSAIAEEMDRYIQEFKKIAEENNLE